MFKTKDEVEKRASPKFVAGSTPTSERANDS